MKRDITQILKDHFAPGERLLFTEKVKVPVVGTIIAIAIVTAMIALLVYLPTLIPITALAVLTEIIMVISITLALAKSLSLYDIVKLFQPYTLVATNNAFYEIRGKEPYAVLYYYYVDAPIIAFTDKGFSIILDKDESYSRNDPKRKFKKEYLRLLKNKMLKRDYKIIFTPMIFDEVLGRSTRTRYRIKSYKILRAGELNSIISKLKEENDKTGGVFPQIIYRGKMKNKFIE